MLFWQAQFGFQRGRQAQRNRHSAFAINNEKEGGEFDSLNMTV